MIDLSGLLRVTIAVVLAALLSACTLISDELLVSDAEVVTPLPAKPFLFGYDQDGPGEPYRLTGDGPLTMTLETGAYIASDGTLSARFVPLDEPDTYLLAATGNGSTTYAVARYADSILELRVMLGNGAKAAFETADLPGVTIDGEGYKVPNRDVLDQAVAMVRGGTFEVISLVFFIADNKDAAAPRSIIQDGNRMKPGS
jgi:hypothetical protein